MCQIKIAIVVTLVLFTGIAAWKNSDAQAETIMGSEGQVHAEKWQKLQVYLEESAPQITSVVVMHRGERVFEYFNGITPDTPYRVCSVTKSIISALIGIALEQGLIANIDQKASDFFPEYVNEQTDPKVREMTIRHLLTMTSGIPYHIMDYNTWRTLDNPIQVALESTPVSEPGNVFNYNDPGVHILSGILSKATNMNALEFANQHLFTKLGITVHNWPMDKQGNNIGASEIMLTPDDMIKFGQLYINKGVWNGDRIIPAEWVAESTREHNKGGFPSNERYGYLWWITEVKAHPAHFAMGWGGQFIYVIPDLQAVVTVTSSHNRHYEENRGIVELFVVDSLS